MRSYLKKKIPKLPQWRWVVLCIDAGRPISVPEKHQQTFNKFMEYLRESFEDPSEAVGFVDVYSEEAEEALELNKVKPVKSIIRRMLSERVPYSSIVEVLDYKFRIKTSEIVIDTFKKLFWDVDSLNTYEIAVFLNESGDSEPPPPTINKYRSAYTEFKNGADVMLNPEDVLKHMLNRAFFRSEELFKSGNDMLAIRAQRAAMDIAKNLRLFSGKENEESLSDIFQFGYKDETHDLNMDEEDVEIPDEITARQ